MKQAKFVIWNVVCCREGEGGGKGVEFFYLEGVHFKGVEYFVGGVEVAEMIIWGSNPMCLNCCDNHTTKLIDSSVVHARNKTDVFTLLTIVFLVRVEMEDALDEMLKQHCRMALKKHLCQAEIG